MADAKIGLLNLGANLVGTGLEAAKEIRGDHDYGYQPRPAYPRRYPAYRRY